MIEHTIIQGDCREAMKARPDNFYHSIVTDPPYGLSFMGKEWDHGVPGIPFWQEALRVCRPGAHLLAFGGTRTHHRLMVAITPEKASMICRMEAPYPLNYLPSGDDQQRALGMFIGLMIHKEIFYQRTKGGAR